MAMIASKTLVVSGNINVAEVVMSVFPGAYANVKAVENNGYVQEAWSVNGPTKALRVEIALYKSGKLVVQKADEEKVAELAKKVMPE